MGAAPYVSAVTQKETSRLSRLFDRLGTQVPAARGFLDWVRRPSSRLVRIPLGILLVLGGIFSILPLLGIWMLPLGLLILALDVPLLQGPTVGAITRVERWWSNWRRRRRDRKAGH